MTVSHLKNEIARLIEQYNLEDIVDVEVKERNNNADI